VRSLAPSYFPTRPWLNDAAGHTGIALLRPLQFLIAQPALVFLLTLTVMLFRPPDVQFCSLDRIAFVLLVLVVALRVSLLQQSLPEFGLVTWPMLGLLLLALAGVVTQPYEAQTWSVFAAKWVVPFVLFHLAGLVFEDHVALRRFETFALIVLAYLSFTAIAFLLGLKEFIFPRFILDQDVGIHADRARGPFLQAVANGVTLNLLGLMAMDAYRRGRLRGALAVTLLIALPLAILATRTRSVWLSFAGSILFLLLRSSSPPLRRACLGLVLAGAIGLLLALAMGDGSLSDRLGEQGPLDYRTAVYDAGWQMFLEKPLLGWSTTRIQPELASRISGFRVEAFFFHNAYLEIAVEHGLLGLGLYLWIVIDLLRIARRRPRATPSGFLDLQFRSLWPVMVMVYLVNASFVGMNYQFVNGFLFTLAGILAAQSRGCELQKDVLR
jgi:hypothetical protein